MMFNLRGRISLRPISGLALLLALALLVVLNVGSGVHPARSEVEKWTSVVLLYHTDVKGKLDPCG
jgi:hypothetical protein